MSPGALEWGLNTEEKGGWKSRWTEPASNATVQEQQCETGSFRKQPVGGHPCERIS